MNVNQTPAQAAQSMNCTLQVPANPLSRARPGHPVRAGRRLHDVQRRTCRRSSRRTSSTGGPAAIKVYNPLVITQGTAPAARPVPPRLPRGDVVGIMFGFNGNNLMLTGTGNSLQQGNCVNGLGQSLFTQVAYCNSPAFYQAANRDIARGLLKIPALGTGSDGQACPTVRELRRGGPGPERQRGDHLPADPRTGQTAQDSRGQRGRPGRGHADQQRQRQRAGQQVHGPGARLHAVPVPRTDHGRAGASGSQITDELLAAADQAAAGRPGPAERPDDPGQRAAERGQDRPVPGRRGPARGGRRADRGQPGELLQGHDADRHGPDRAGREAVQQLRLAGAGHRQQPVHVPGRAAVRVVRRTWAAAPCSTRPTR